MAEQLHTDVITIVNQREDNCHRIGVDVVINSDYKIKKEKYLMFSENIKQINVIRKDAFKAVLIELWTSPKCVVTSKNIQVVLGVVVEYSKSINT